MIEYITLLVTQYDRVHYITSDTKLEYITLLVTQYDRVHYITSDTK